MESNLSWFLTYKKNLGFGHIGPNMGIVLLVLVCWSTELLSRKHVSQTKSV